MITIKCKKCGKKRDVYPSDIKNGRGKFCSKQCYWKSLMGRVPSYSFPKGHIPWNKGLMGTHFSPKTEFKKGIHPLTQFKKGHPKPKNAYVFPVGLTHPKWKGKTNFQGYMLIRLSALSKQEQALFKSMFSKQNGCLEHRLVVARQLNRPLQSKERIHHINETKNDNRPKNLYLFQNNLSHTAYHTLKRNNLIDPITKSNII